MTILTIITAVFILLIACGLSFLIIKYVECLNEKTQLENYFERLTYVVNQTRWGNLNARAETNPNKNAKAFCESLNRLIETFDDREVMLNEYHNELVKNIESEKEKKLLKEEFIATLTHDLKVPVIAQDNICNLLLNNTFGELNKEVQEAILNLRISNNEVKHLIETMLETYRMDEAKIALNPQNVEIKGFLAKIVSDMKPVALKNSQTILMSQIQEKTVILDEFLIERSIKNLILNAITYGFPNTQIDIEFKTTKKEIKISVINRGIGVSKDEIESLFEKYYSSATKFRKLGTGLGLYFANKVAKLHGGRIEVESKLNEKTEFTLILPLINT